MKAKMTQTLYWVQYEWRDEPIFHLSGPDMQKTSPNWVRIREVELEFDVPDDFDPRPQQIQALRTVKQSILAEAHVKAENIEGQIQSLLAIEDKR